MLSLRHIWYQIVGNHNGNKLLIWYFLSQDILSRRRQSSENWSVRCVYLCIHGKIKLRLLGINCDQNHLNVSTILLVHRHWYIYHPSYHHQSNSLLLPRWDIWHGWSLFIWNGFDPSVTLGGGDITNQLVRSNPPSLNVYMFTEDAVDECRGIITW